MLTVPSLTIRYSFSGHETFPFRYAWLPKGVQGVSARPDLFGAEDTMVELGVGKNMVAAIRFWCEAMRLVEAVGNTFSPTDLGRLLLGPEGHDPYLEDIGTLWLLLGVVARDRARFY